VRLRPDLAEAAIRDKVADRLFDGDSIQAAAGIRTVVDSQMAGLVRKMTIERGHDPRDFTMIAYGGAGPLHAVGYGKALGIRRIVVPATATAFSAHGAAVSDIHHSLERSIAGSPSDTEVIIRAFEQLEDAGRALLASQAIGDEDVTIARWADMRYERQLHDVRIRVTDMSPPALRAAFEQQYTRLYGPEAALPDGRIRLLRVGLEAIGRMEEPGQVTLASDAQIIAGATRTSRSTSRRVYWPDEGRFVDTSIYDATLLPASTEVEGPALFDQPGTTVAVPPGAKALVGSSRHIIISL
jgi:N-methylhydantoinase A